MMKFDVLDNISFGARSFLLVLCGLTCCWGFVNNTILLVLAGKIGFPLAVCVCAISYNHKQIANLCWYTLLLVLTGTLFFLTYPVEVDFAMRKNFVPSWLDFLLAVGLGAALEYFWNHGIRINVIVMSAGLASLLPACVMAGYYISQWQVSLAEQSLLLYLQYVFGMYIGALLSKKCLNQCY